MFKTHTAKRKSGNRKLLTLGMATLVIVAIGMAKLALAHRNSGWVDIYDTQSGTMTSTMSIGQIEASLEDISKQYEGLLNSPSNSTVFKLRQLYQLSAKDYTNATALARSANNNPVLNNLTQSSSLLTSSIFEMKDSLLYTGNFGVTQRKQSREDLAAAVREIAQVRQELRN